MKISIITPSFNQAAFIKDTIDSILSQNYPNLEYIIIDGGSTDGSVDVIKDFENKLSYWVSKKDRGQSHAINKGFERATGDIIAWLNSDDLYLPNTFKEVADIFKRRPDVDVIYGDVENFSSLDSTYYQVANFEPLDFISRVAIHQPSVFWRRKVLEEIGQLDESLHYCMDYDLWMRLFFNYKSLKVNKTFSKFRIHETSKTSSNPPEMYLEYRRVLSRFFNSWHEKSIISHLMKLGIYDNEFDVKYELNINELKPIREKLIETYVRQCAIQEYSFGNIKNANKLFLNSTTAESKLKTFSYLMKNNLRLKKNGII